MSTRNRRSMKIKNLCSQCNMELEEDDEEVIGCDKCDKKYHVVCTTLDKRKYEYLLNHESEEYVCHQCVDVNSGTLKKDLNEIKTELKKIDHLQETMTFMSKQFDEILKGVADNKKKIEVVQKENKILKEEVKALKNSIQILNDHRVKNDCFIRGVKVESGATAVDTVLKLTSEVGVKLKSDTIEDAYFIKKRSVSNDKKSDTQAMVVKFNSKLSKDLMMSIKPKLKENETTKDVFVNDMLSRETMNLFNYAKALKNVGYRSVYTASGRVFIKRSELSKAKMIRSEDEVDKLLLEATTNKQKRRSQRPEADDEDVNDVYLSP